MDPNAQQPSPAAEQPAAPQNPTPSMQPITPAASAAPQPTMPPTYEVPVQQPGVAPQLVTAPSQPAAPMAGTEDPGKKLGTLSIVLCWLTWIAIIIGIVGLRKSRKAGFKGTRAIIGIMISSVIFVAALIFLVLFTMHLTG